MEEEPQVGKEAIQMIAAYDFELEEVLGVNRWWNAEGSACKMIQETLPTLYDYQNQRVAPWFLEVVDHIEQV